MSHRWFLILLNLVVIHLATATQAQITVFENKSDFSTSTCAAPNANDYPPYSCGGSPCGPPGCSKHVGMLTFSLGPCCSFQMFFGDFTTLMPGREIGISGPENLNVDIDFTVHSIGFDYVEPTEGDFMDSTFEVTLKRAGAFIAEFDFNRPYNVASFVGVYSEEPFDRIEIREITICPSPPPGDHGWENEYFGEFYVGPQIQPSCCAAGTESSPVEAIAFQDEGTTEVDTLCSVASQDGIWSPTDVAPFGTVEFDYFASGTSELYFDAISLRFDPAGFDPSKLVLSLFLQKGAYPWHEDWEHYELLPGSQNSTHEDTNPSTVNPLPPDIVDHYPGGVLPLNQTVGWVAIPFDATSDAQFTLPNGDIGLTIRLWNWRVDAIELRSNVGSLPFSTFESGFEGWTSTTGVTWQSAGGNPGGFLRFVDAGPPDGGRIFAPGAFLGDWTHLNNVGQFQYDFRVFQSSPPHFHSWILISGPGGQASWSGPPVTGPTDWNTLIAPVSEESWNIVSGDWSGLLADVEEVRISMPTSSNGSEITGVDNVHFTVPPSDDGVSLERLFVTGDVIQQNPPGSGMWQISGNVLINSFLRVTGDVTVNTSTLRISGNGQIWLDGVVGLGDVLLYSGAWEFDGLGGSTTSLIEAESFLLLSGLGLRVDSITVSGDVVRLQGAIDLPPFLGGARVDVSGDQFIQLSQSLGLVYEITIEDVNIDLSVGGFTFAAQNAGVSLGNVGGGEIIIFGTYTIPLLGGIVVDLDPDEGNYFRISGDGEIELVGSIEILERINLAPGLYLDEAYLNLDTVSHDYSGGGIIGIPLGRDGVEIGAELGVVGGCFDSVAMVVQDIGYAIITTPTAPPVPIVFLESVGGGVAGLCPDDEQAIVITISGAFTVGPEFEVDGDDWSLIYLLLTAKLDLSGRVTGEATLKIGNQNDPFLEGGATVIFDLGDGVYLAVYLTKSWNGESFLDFSGQAAVDWSNRFQAGLDGSITIPDDMPVLGCLLGGQGFAAQAYAQASDDGDNSNDYFAAGLRAEVEMDWGIWSFGHVIEISLDDGDIDWNSSWDRVREVDFPDVIPFGPMVPEPFTVDSGVSLVIFRASWEVGTTDLILTDPDGNSITPETSGNDPNTSYRTNPAVPEAFYVIKDPAAGEWLLEVTETVGIGAFTLNHWQESSAPTIALIEPATDTGAAPVNITWTASDSDSEATISLFYDLDREGADGLTIVTGLVEGVDSIYAWSPISVQSGDYYVYAVIDDGMNQPAISYSVGRVHVENSEAPSAPTGLAAAAGDGSDEIRLAWSASTASDIDHYTIYYTTDSAGEGYQQSVGAGDSTNLTFGGTIPEKESPYLVPGQRYRFAVAAVDVDGNVGSKSQPILVTLIDPTNNNPIFTGCIASRATVDQLYRSQVLAADIDGQGITYVLGNEPTGMTVSVGGLIEWTPAQDQIGNNTFEVTLGDGAGGANQRSYTIHVSGAPVGDSPPEILSQAPALAQPGALYVYQLIVNDADAGDSLTFDLLDGPDNATISNEGLIEFNTPAGSDRYDFLIKVTDGGGLFDIQRCTVQADASAPDIDVAGWGTAMATAPDTIEIEADPVPDATGLVEYQLEVDGAPGAWQRSSKWVNDSIIPNTLYSYRARARDASAEQNESGWSDMLSRHTLASVPPPPALTLAEENVLNVTLDPGLNPATTELALWNASNGEWVASDGIGSADPVWAEAGTWGTVTVQELMTDTTYHLQTKARNEEGKETTLSDVLAEQTLAPDSKVAFDPIEAEVLENVIGSTERQVMFTVSFDSDPYGNTEYNHIWVAPTHPETGKQLALLSGGGPNDNSATYAAPEFEPGSSAGSADPYAVQCTVTGVEQGNYVYGIVAVAVHMLGDADEDFDVDLDDFASYIGCFTGDIRSPDHQPPEGECDSIETFDFDGDDDVDLLDWGMFQIAFSETQ